MRARRCLLLGRRVPPRGGVDHVARARQVEPRAARQERNAEHVELAALERLDDRPPLRRGRLAREIRDAQTCRLELGLQLSEELRELTEDERAIALLRELHADL